MIINKLLELQISKQDWLSSEFNSYREAIANSDIVEEDVTFSTDYSDIWKIEKNNVECIGDVRFNKGFSSDMAINLPGEYFSFEFDGLILPTLTRTPANYWNANQIGFYQRWDNSRRLVKQSIIDFDATLISTENSVAKFQINNDGELELLFDNEVVGISEISDFGEFYHLFVTGSSESSSQYNKTAKLTNGKIGKRKNIKVPLVIDGGKANSTYSSFLN